MKNQLIAAALLLGACSSSSSNPPADGASACNSVVNAAPVVSKTTHAGAPPAMTGGTIVDGTYYLTAMDKYNGMSGSNTHQETWVFSAGHVDIASLDSSQPPELHASGTYTVAGNVMTLQITCPSSGNMMSPYTATATQLQIVNANDPNEIHTFTKQ